MLKQEPPEGGFLTTQPDWVCQPSHIRLMYGTSHNQHKEIVMKKQQPKPKAQRQSSVVVRKSVKATPFKDALSKAETKWGRPASKLQAITDALGHEFHTFVEACCGNRVTTAALTQAVKDLGVPVSYGAMLGIRKKIQAENQWFYQMVQDIVDKGGVEPNGLADTDTNYNDDKYWAFDSPIEQ
jgi:hypothetical protein